MKERDLEYGSHSVGRFTIQVCPCVFETRRVDDVVFFEVMVIEAKPLLPDAPKGSFKHPFYVHLAEDPRFGLFSDYGKFERYLRVDEVVEHNAYVDRKRLSQPTWKLGRTTLLEVFMKCKDAKPLKKSAQ